MNRAADPARPPAGPGGSGRRASVPGGSGRGASCRVASLRPGRPDRGSATAELAVGLPALLLLLLAGLTAVGAVTTQLRCVDAARDAALAASRGEPGAEAGERAAPPGAQVTVTRTGDLVTATVRAPVPLLGARLPRLRVGATAVAAAEPGSPSLPPLLGPPSSPGPVPP